MSRISAVIQDIWTTPPGSRPGPQLGSRIPSLDGLRALSILFVCLGHATGTAGFPLSHVPFWRLGLFGVRVFFVISGLLITSLLLHEYEARGGIDLPRFYLRRTLRIFPPYYVFLFAVAIASALSWVRLNPGDLLHALTYTSIYKRPPLAWDLAHTWSLSVEEQFYLVWPFVLALLGKRRSLWFAAAFVVAVSVIQYATYFGQVLPRWPAGRVLMFQTVAIGSVLAGTRNWLWERPWYRAIQHSRLAVLAPLLTLGLLYSNLEQIAPRAMYVLGYAIEDLGIAFTVDWCVRNPSGIVGRALNSGPLVTIGVMSYSIYLWQNLFLDRTSTGLAARFPLNMALVAVFALASYRLVERPSFELRARLERRLSERKTGSARET